MPNELGNTRPFGDDVRRRQRLALILQLFLVLAAGLLGVVTNFATDGKQTSLPLRLLEQAAVPGLVLILVVLLIGHFVAYRLENPAPPEFAWASGRPGELGRDRKSTRLNSSHVSISYAVFCLKTKKK